MGWNPIKYNPLVRLARPQKLERHIAARFSFGEKRGKRTRFFFEFVRLRLCFVNLKNYTKQKQIKKPPSIARTE